MSIFSGESKIKISIYSYHSNLFYRERAIEIINIFEISFRVMIDRKLSNTSALASLVKVVRSFRVEKIRS